MIMSERRQQVVSIGECMVELARDRDGRYGLGYGGDTFNTAIYLARAGVRVAYATLLGDDPYSAAILDLARGEDVATDLIERREGRNAGLYLIETSPAGERTFHYWRDRAPARELFDGDSGARVAEAMGRADIIYLSGVTLSLYPPPALDRLAAALGRARQQGARVAMDGNYRPRGWDRDNARARTTFERFWRLADVALPSLEDEALLWGDDKVGSILRRLEGLGVGEIVIKCAGAPAVCSRNGQVIEVPVTRAVAALDSTAAGDSFNAAYLAASLAGASQRAAAEAGHRLAGVVIGHRGAIVPRAATARVLSDLTR